jgi:hypothetical protein
MATKKIGQKTFPLLLLFVFGSEIRDERKSGSGIPVTQHWFYSALLKLWGFFHEIVMIYSINDLMFF